MKSCSLLVFFAVALLFLTAAPGANAQQTLFPDYYANANTSGAPDGTVRIVNPGTASDSDLCANIYVFDNSQEMQECCSCLTTPDGLLTLSVNSDLLSNTLTGEKPTTGSFKIVSSNTAPFCSGESIAAAATLRVWVTHVQANGSAFVLTETESAGAGLSSAEITSLEDQCDSINDVGSGHGTCSCGFGSVHSR